MPSGVAVHRNPESVLAGRFNCKGIDPGEGTLVAHTRCAHSIELTVEHGIDGNLQRRCKGIGARSQSDHR